MTILMPPLHGESLIYKSLKDFFYTPKTPTLKLDDVVKKSADITLAKAERGEIILNPGRLSLLQEMSKEPEQLSKDLPRLPIIKIGNNIVLASWRKDKTPQQQFVLLANLLTKYVGKHRPALVDPNNPSHIGLFDVEEILYSIGQGFSAQALELAYKHPVLKSGEWAAIAGLAQQYASFALENSREAIMAVSFSSEKNLVNLLGHTRRTRKLIIQSKLYFYLLSGEVRFFYSYSIDGKGSARVVQAL